MARVKVSNVKKVQASVLNDMDSIVKDKKLLKDIEVYIVERIVNQARLGKSMATGRRLPALSNSYKQWRGGKFYFRTIRGRVVPIAGRDPKFTKTDKFFRPNNPRSNWTLSGTFLKSIKARILRSRRLRGTIVLQPTGRRRNGPLNKQILKWLTELNPDYQILGLDKTAINGISSRVTRSLRRKLKDRRKNRK